MRKINRLTARTVASKGPGRHGDGGGLWLQVSPTGTRSWLFRYMLNGKARQMGLGPVHTISLAEAREAAALCRKQLLSGVDPIEARNAERSRLQATALKGVTFETCAHAYIAAHEPSWKSPVHRQQWRATLEAYAYPLIGDRTVAAIDTSAVIKVLQPIWRQKPETASRLRGRLEAILDWATARGHRTGENPARWKGHLANLLPAPNKLRLVRHHPALPYSELPEFMRGLRSREELASKALQFTILTAARTGEALGARWSEFDLTTKVWTIPAERMKAGRPHRIPLSPYALRLLSDVGCEYGTVGFVFPGNRPDRPLSNMAMLALLKRMGRTDLTVHGFRSTFRDWCGERTNHPRDVAEMALAHTIGDKVEAAYRRGDLFEKRYRLMNDWAAYCESEPSLADVVPIGLTRAQQ